MKITRLTPALFALVLAACSGDDSADFTAYVATLSTTTEAPQPLAGASAFLDTAAGVRIEATSDTNGQLVFHGADFTMGPASLTVYKSGYVMSTMVGITPDAVAKLPLPLSDYPTSGKNLLVLTRSNAPADDTVTLTGKVLGKLDSTDVVTFSAVNARGFFQSANATYSLPVAKGKPLDLVALEWKPETAVTGGSAETKIQWRKLSAPAQSADGTFDLDVSTGTVLTPTKDTLTLKFGTATSQAPFWGVYSTDGGLFLGSRSVVTPNGDGSFKAEGEWVAHPDAAGQVMTVAQFPGYNGDASFFQKLGPPTDGMTITGLGYPATPLATPVGGVVKTSDLDPAGEVVNIEIVDWKGPNSEVVTWVVGTVRGGPLPSSVQLPDLPAAARALLPAKPKGRVAVFADSLDPAHPAIAGRGAYSQFFDVTP